MGRRLGAWLTAMALTCSFLPAALAADTTVTVKPPGEPVRAGDAFTVDVDLTGNPGFNAAQFVIGFDREAMECTSADLGGILSGSLGATNAKGPDGAVVGAASVGTISEDGTLASFRFTAKRDVEEYAFTLSDLMLLDSNGNRVSCTVSGAEEKKTAQAAPAAQDTQTVPDSPEKTPEAAAAPAAPTAQSGSLPPEPAQPESEAAGTEEAPASPFADTKGHWGERWVAKAARRGLFSGYPDGGFHPDVNVSRADFVLVLWRMAGKPAPKAAPRFADVAPDAYYADAVAWAGESGLVGGREKGFAPAASLTRQEAMKILFAYSGGQSGLEAMLTGVYDQGFADSADVAAWAKPALYWGVYNMLISGMDGGLNPSGLTTRAQLAKILVSYQDTFPQPKGGN